MEKPQFKSAFTKLFFIQFLFINYICKASFSATNFATHNIYQNQIHNSSSSDTQIRVYPSSNYQGIVQTKQGVESGLQNNRLLQIQTQDHQETHDQSCHYSCSTCLDGDYFSCNSCYGGRTMKQSINSQVAMCLCGLGSVDEGSGSCSSSSNQNLEITLKALFSSAFGVNLLTSFVVWNPMYFLSFNEFSQVISQMAYVNKLNPLNFDQITYFITNSHLDKILTLQSVSDYSLSSTNSTTTREGTLQNPKILLNEKDTSFLVNTIFLIILNVVAWLICIFGRNDVKYHYLFQISTPIIIYIMTFNSLNLFALFQFSNLSFSTPLSSASFFFALIALLYLFSFFGYMFYYLCLKQVLNEEKQTSQLKQYLQELQILIAQSADEDDEEEEEKIQHEEQDHDDVFSKKSHLSNSKPLNQKQNGQKNDHDAHSMILKELEHSENNRENNDIQRKSEKINYDQHCKSINILDGQYASRNLDNESTQFENDSPVKPKNFQLLSEINKNKSCADLLPNHKLDDQKSADRNSQQIHGQNLQDQNEQLDKLEEVKSIDQEGNSQKNKNMQLREEELKLKLIEQEFILQKNRSMFYFLFIFVKQNNFVQRGFFIAVIFRKLIFSLINLYIYENPKTQMVLLMLVEITFVLYSFVARPFQMRLQNIFFFLFETIALICFIIFTSIASEDTEISSQIRALKAICSLLIFAYIIFLFIGIGGIVLLIMTLIKDPAKNVDEEQQSLKDNENKKSHPSDEEDEKNHRNGKELAKGEHQEHELQSPQILSRSNSPAILQSQQESAYSQRGRLIRPFQSVNNVLLEADEEDDDDFNTKKQNENNRAQTSQKPAEQKQEVEMIRRPVQQQLTIIRQQAEELFQQQKELFERNREKRLIKTMVLVNEYDSNRQSLTEFDNLNIKKQNNEQNKSIPDLPYANFDSKNKQNDDEVSFSRLPFSQPQTFRSSNEASQFIGKDGGETTGRKILEESGYKDQKNVNSNQGNNRIQQKKKKSIFSPESISMTQLQQIGLNSNNNSFYAEALNQKIGQGISGFNSPNELSPIKKDHSEYDHDLSMRFSPFISKRQVEKSQQSRLINLNQSETNFDNLGVKPILPLNEKASKISELKGIEDHLEQKRVFVPGSNSDLIKDNGEMSSPEKFTFKLQKNSLRQMQEDSNNKESNLKDSQYFSKPFSKNDSRLATPKQQEKPVINSPLSLLISQKQSELKEQNKNMNSEISPNKNESQKDYNLPTKTQASSSNQEDTTKRVKSQTEINIEQNQNDEKMFSGLQQKIQNINKEKEFNTKKEQNQVQTFLNKEQNKDTLKPEENPLKNNEEKNSQRGSDDYNNLTHNESYIPYDTDLNMYANQADVLPKRSKANKNIRSLILSSFQDKEEKRIRTANVIKQDSLKIDENEQEYNQQEDDYNTKISGPGISFQQK